MRILYLAGRESSYARVSIIKNGLQQNCVDIIDGTIEHPSLPKRTLHLLRTFFTTPQQQYDLLFVGFLGQPFIPLLRRCTRKPIIFDAHMSVYNTAVEDKQILRRDSLPARLARYLDIRSVRDSDVTLLDTNEHINYFQRTFHLPCEKFERVLVGTNDELFYPRDATPSAPGIFTVLFYGGFIPLQGVQYIVRAAKELETDETIRFRIIGNGQTYPAIRALANELGSRNIEFLDMLLPEDVPGAIHQADIGLGIFGDTLKTQMVIPNKVYEVAGMRKPVVTADTPAIHELFTHRENIYLCKHADPSSLAEAILTLRNDQTLRQTIAENAYRCIGEHATQRVIGKQVRGIAERLLGGCKISTAT